MSGEVQVDKEQLGYAKEMAEKDGDHSIKSSLAYSRVLGGIGVDCLSLGEIMELEPEEFKTLLVKLDVPENEADGIVEHVHKGLADLQGHVGNLTVPFISHFDRPTFFIF